jgi:HEAT repeat protein
MTFKTINKIIAITIIFTLVIEQSGFAQVVGPMAVPAYINGYVAADRFRPLQLRSLSFDQINNDFNLFLDKGDLLDLKPREIKENAAKLSEYFQTGLRLPNSIFWVNLRPDSQDQIIDPWLEKTDLGRVMLEADLQLKKDMANFTSPQTPEGKKYWDLLYARAEELYGQSEITIPTLTRPWIVPGEILIRQTKDNAYIYKATLNVMLEQDYLKNAPEYKFDDPRLKTLNEYSSELIRQEILPKLIREVNSSQKYAGLRQVYYSLILAQWFKQSHNVTKSQVTSKIDSFDLTGLASKKSWSKDTYFKAYKKSFSKGEYRLQETVNRLSGTSVRQYFSGGEKLAITPSMIGVIEPVVAGDISNQISLPDSLKTGLIEVRGGNVAEYVQQPGKDGGSAVAGNGSMFEKMLPGLALTGAGLGLGIVSGASFFGLLSIPFFYAFYGGVVGLSFFVSGVLFIKGGYKAASLERVRGSNAEAASRDGGNVESNDSDLVNRVKRYFYDWRFNRLLSRLASENEGVRFSSVQALGKLKDERAVEPLILLLKDKDIVVFASTIEALGDIGGDRAQAAIEGVLKSPMARKYRSIRLEVARALSNFKNARSVAVLAQLREDVENSRDGGSVLSLDQLRMDLMTNDVHPEIVALQGLRDDYLDLSGLVSLPEEKAKFEKTAQELNRVVGILDQDGWAKSLQPGELNSLQNGDILILDSKTFAIYHSHEYLPGDGKYNFLITKVDRNNPAKTPLKVKEEQLDIAGIRVLPVAPKDSEAYLNFLRSYYNSREQQAKDGGRVKTVLAGIIDRYKGLPLEEKLFLANDEIEVVLSALKSKDRSIQKLLARIGDRELTADTNERFFARVYPEVRKDLDEIGWRLSVDRQSRTQAKDGGQLTKKEVRELIVKNVLQSQKDYIIDASNSITLKVAALILSATVLSALISLVVWNLAMWDLALKLANLQAQNTAVPIIIDASNAPSQLSAAASGIVIGTLAGIFVAEYVLNAMAQIAGRARHWLDIQKELRKPVYYDSSLTKQEIVMEARDMLGRDGGSAQIKDSEITSYELVDEIGPVLDEAGTEMRGDVLDIRFDKNGNFQILTGYLGSDQEGHGDYWNEKIFTFNAEGKFIKVKDASLFFGLIEEFWDHWPLGRVVKDRDGNIWEIKQEELIKSNRQGQVLKILPVNRFSNIIADNQGNIWLRDYRRSIKKLDSEGNTLISVPVPGGWAFAVDNNSRVWFVETFDDGKIYKLSKIKVYGVKNGTKADGGSAQLKAGRIMDRAKFLLFASGAERLADKLNNDDPRVRDRAIERLRSKYDAAALSEVLSKFIRDHFNREFGRLKAMYLLAEVNQEAAINVIIPELNDFRVIDDFRRGARLNYMVSFGTLAAEVLVRIGAPAVESLIIVLKSPNYYIRMQAAWALGKIADKRATGPLLEALTDKYVLTKKNAITALAAIKDGRAIAPIKSLLEYSDYEVRQTAIAALKELGVFDKELELQTYVNELLVGTGKAKFTVKYWESFRRQSARALGEMGEAAAPALNQLREILAVEPLLVQTHTLTVMNNHYASSTANPVYVELMHAVAKIEYALRQKYEPQSKSPLILQSAEGVLLQGMRAWQDLQTEALQNISDPEIARLVEIITMPIFKKHFLSNSIASDPDTRLQAAQLIGRQGSKAEGVLKYLVKAVAMESPVDFSDYTDPERSASSNYTREALQQSIESIKNAIRYRDARAVSAQDSFVLQVDQKIKDAVDDFLRKEENIENWRNMDGVILKIGEPAENALIGMLKDPNTQVRRIAVSVLADIGSARAIEAVEEQLNDPEESVRKRAINGLYLPSRINGVIQNVYAKAAYERYIKETPGQDKDGGTIRNNDRQHEGLDIIWGGGIVQLPREVIEDFKKAWNEVLASDARKDIEMVQGKIEQSQRQIRDLEMSGPYFQEALRQAKLAHDFLRQFSVYEMLSLKEKYGAATVKAELEKMVARPFLDPETKEISKKALEELISLDPTEAYLRKAGISADYVRMIYDTLEMLSRTEPAALYDLYMLSRNSAYVLKPESLRTLVIYILVETDGHILSPQIQIIVQAAVKEVQNNRVVLVESAGALNFNNLKDGGDTQPPANTGGVDFRALPAVVQPMVNPAVGMNVANMISLRDLDKQWSQIQSKIYQGEMPYQEIKLYVSACCGQKAAAKQLAQVSEGITNILKMEEERALPTAPELKEILSCLG